jgi:Transposase DDE domain
MTGSSLVDRSKLGQAKRHILTDRKGMSLSTSISSASAHDLKAVTDVIDNAVLDRPSESYYKKKKTRRKYSQQQHLCLDRAYSSKSIEKEIIKRGYIPHIPYKRGQKQENTHINSRNTVLQGIKDGL